MDRRTTTGRGACLTEPPAGTDAQETLPPELLPPELTCRISPEGEAVVGIGGDLDIVSADAAFGYVRDVIDRCHVPLAVDLAAVRYCDARGLTALERMADYAELAGCRFRLVSPGKSLVKIMRITGLDGRFLASHVPAQPTRR